MRNGSWNCLLCPHALRRVLVRVPFPALVRGSEIATVAQASLRPCLVVARSSAHAIYRNRGLGPHSSSGWAQGRHLAQASLRPDSVMARASGPATTHQGPGPNLSSSGGRLARANLRLYPEVVRESDLAIVRLGPDLSSTEVTEKHLGLATLLPYLPMVRVNVPKINHFYPVRPTLTHKYDLGPLRHQPSPLVALAT